MAKKINMSAVKEFMFHHGEKVALGTCVFVALIFGLLGLMRAMSAGRADGSSDTYAAEFKKHRDRINGEISRVQPPEYEEAVLKRLDPIFYKQERFVSHHFQSPYNNFPGQDELKRINPPALAIRKALEPDAEKKPGAKAELNPIQMQYMSGLVLVHEVNGNQLKGLDVAGATGGAGAVGTPMPVMGKNPPMGNAPGAVTALPYPVLKAAVPVRMVVVSAVFPMKQQMEEFQRALRMFNQSEMYYEDLPKPLGINVERFEVVNGKPVEKSRKTILSYDPATNKATKNQALDDLLRIAIYDEHLPVALEASIWAGLTTPMPKFANARYPKFELPGDIAYDEEEKKAEVAVVGPMPPNTGKGPPPKVVGPIIPGGDKRKPPMPEVPNMPEPGGGGVEYKVVSMTKKEVQKADFALYARLFEKPHDYNVFHALGLYPPPKDGAAVKTGAAPPMVGAGQNVQQGRYFSAWDIAPPAGPADGGEGPMPKNPMGGVRPMAPPMPGGAQPAGPGGVAGGANRAAWDRDALVRFIDNDVEPGKTYQYAVLVHLANPNFNKKAEVAFAGLAEIRALASKWEYTPVITIPRESYLYAVDQHLLTELAEGKEKKKKDGKPDPFLLKKDETTFQLHQWVEKSRDRNNNTLWIGDWAVAERVVVRRGEAIGSQATVNVPYWHKEKDAFEVPRDILEKDPKKPKENILKQGLKMDFPIVGDLHPILVDFTGGKHGAGTAAEESAVEALIISADGKLSVLNSRIDSDPAFTAAKNRNERLVNARHRVDEILSGGSSASADPMQPMNPMTPKIPGSKRP